MMMHSVDRDGIVRREIVTHASCFRHHVTIEICNDISIPMHIENMNVFKVIVPWLLHCQRMFQFVVHADKEFGKGWNH